MHKWNISDSFPVVITVFSAPNYCDIYNNKGALLKFDVFANILCYFINYKEQYPQYSTIWPFSTSLFAYKFYGCFYMVSSFSNRKR